MKKPLILLLAVKFNGKAVGLLLNLADEGENRLIVVNADLLPLSARWPIRITAWPAGTWSIITMCAGTTWLPRWNISFM